MPANKDPAGGKPARARAPAWGALIVSILLVVGCNATTSPSPSPTLEPTATLEPTPSPSAVGDDPAADLNELVTRLYDALDSQDATAFASFMQAGAIHLVYYTNGTTGSQTASIPMDGYDPADGGWTAVEATGEPLTVGDMIVVPVTYTYPEGVYRGFDVMTVVQVPGGLLLGDGATFYGSPDSVPATAEDTLLAEAAAWTAGDADAVLGLFTADGAFWDGVVGPDRAFYSGDDLATWLADTVGFTVETVGDPLVSGTFVTAIQRLTGDTADDTGDALCIWEVRLDKIALHVVVITS
jgi:hypothetical protein